MELLRLINMVLIQINLTKEQNKIVELFKINNDLLTKEEAIKKIIQLKQNDK